LFSDFIDNKGVEYFADYSANYTNRSLVDKEYVDNQVAGVANIYTADGSLSGSRTISMGTNNLQFDSTGQTGLLFADSVNNRIGIGTNTPTHKLQVTGQIRATNFSGADGTAGSPIYRFNSDTNTGMFRGAADQLAFTTGGTERLRIDDGGNIGIGITIPTAQLHTTGTVRFANFGAGTLQTDANGNVSVSSDERLKNIQGVFNRGLTELLNIDPIEYKWKKKTGYDTENSYYGFSAQNVKLSIPEAVGLDSRGYLTLSDRPILATAINAIKELNQKQEEQEVTINANTLKTDTNIQTLAELQTSIDENLMVIDNSLTNLQADLADLNDRTSNNETRLSSLELNNQKTINEEKLTELLTFMEKSKDDEGQPVATFTDGMWGVVKDIVFSGKAIFEDTVAFLGKITFMDRVTFADKDMAGRATINKDETNVKVKFDKEFVFAPYVTATANNEYVLFKVTKVTEKGFEIKVKEKAKKDLQFTWQALAVAKAEEVENDSVNNDNDIDESTNNEDEINQQGDDQEQEEIDENQGNDEDEVAQENQASQEENERNESANENNQLSNEEGNNDADVDENNTETNIENETENDTNNNLEETEDETLQIVVLDNELGFVRVRQAATTNSDELTQVKPGDKFTYTETKNGWYKIEYAQDEFGWISGTYTEEL